MNDFLVLATQKEVRLYTRFKHIWDRMQELGPEVTKTLLSGHSEEKLAARVRKKIKQGYVLDSLMDYGVDKDSSVRYRALMIKQFTGPGEKVLKISFNSSKITPQDLAARMATIAALIVAGSMDGYTTSNLDENPMPWSIEDIG